MEIMETGMLIFWLTEIDFCCDVKNLGLGGSLLKSGIRNDTKPQILEQNEFMKDIKTRQLLFSTT
jgi:hypothetical protein